MGQFEISDWVELLVTGSEGALARKPWPGIPSQKTRSRFALNAGEGARVPSTESSLKLKLTQYARADRSVSSNFHVISFPVYGHAQY